MMNEEFQTSFKRRSSITLQVIPCFADSPFFSAGIQDIKIDYGLALQDVITGIYDYLRTVDIGNAAQIYLLDQLASIECVFTPLVANLSLETYLLSLEYRHRLSTGGMEKLQLSAMLGSFKNAVEISAKNKKP